MFRKVLLALMAALPLPAHAAATFFWTCDGTTLGSSDFSAGDTTASASGGITISSSSPLKGSNSCLTAAMNASYFVIDPASIASTGEMTFAAMFRWTTTAPTVVTFSKPLGIIDNADNDSAGFASTTAPRSRLTIRKQGSANRNLDLTSTTIAADTTYFLTGGYDIANDRRFIRLYDSNCALLDQAVDTSTDLSGDQPGNFTDIRIGSNTGESSILRVDTVVITNDYDDPIADACPWTSFYPTFTSALSAGTHGETTLQVTYTPDQPGTGYVVACPDGQTANHAQIVAGNCSGGAAAASFSEAGASGVGETKMLTGLSPGTTYDVFGTYINTLGGAKASVSSLANQTTDASTGGPVFDTGPTVTGIAGGFRIAGEIDANATVYFAGLNPGATPPADCNALQALSGSALWFGSEAWTGGAADTFDVTDSNKPVRINGFVCAENGDGISDVFTFEGKDRLARSGYAIVALTSLSSTGIGNCSDCINGGSSDAYYEPDIAVGDVFEYQDETNESADCAVAISAEGDIEYTPTNPGDCSGVQTFPYSAQDVSNATDGLFTAPAGMFTTDDEIATGNTAPVCPGPEVDIIVLREDEEMTPIDLSQAGQCEDEDGDLLTASISSGTLPNGTSLTGTGDLSWEGTPDTEDETGEELEVTVCDPFDECDTFTFTVYVVDTWTVPDCVTNTASECADEIVTAAPWRESDVGFSISALTCDVGTAGLVLTQDPAASAEAEPFEEITATLSRKCAAGGADKVKRMRARKTPGAIRVVH